MVEEKQKFIWQVVPIKHMKMLKEGENNDESIMNVEVRWRVTDNQGINF